MSRPSLYPQQENTVHIYLRNHKKIAIMLPVYTPIINHHLKMLIAQKLHAQQASIAVFVSGMRLDEDPNKISNIREKSIVHVVHLERTAFKEINVCFMLHEDSKQMLRVKTTPWTVIKEVFYSEVLPHFCRGEKQLFLAYLGKPINIFKTFIEEYIEDECQIILLAFKKKMIRLMDQHFKLSGSTPSTVVLGMPVPGARTKAQMQESKNKMSQKNKQKPFFLKPQQTAPQDEQKKQFTSQVKQQVAPSQPTASVMFEPSSSLTSQKKVQSPP